MTQDVLITNSKTSSFKHHHQHWKDLPNEFPNIASFFPFLSLSNLLSFLTVSYLHVELEGSDSLIHQPLLCLHVQF